MIYVIGLHAVQFGNDLMKKIPRKANFFNSVISTLDKHDIAGSLIQIVLHFLAFGRLRSYTVSFLIWTVCLFLKESPV